MPQITQSTSLRTACLPEVLMNDCRREMTPKFARRAARLRALCEKLGLKPLDESRVQAIFERRVERRRRDDIYADCMSVTATAKALGLRRGDLFELFVREGWLYRTSDDRWRATAQALTDGVAVMRGPSSIAWPQLTPDGRAEISRRLAHG
ncbi:phage antirepressor KilAC domain-containing protein [Paraburkholderia sp. CI3]|uniref:phage antirepressor KilAC domain-containing protein n=1 Tax=Paraburkholderia sp. CI3 TaxID=2991060 RepID=UPI003D1AE58A